MKQLDGEPTIWVSGDTQEDENVKVQKNPFNVCDLHFNVEASIFSFNILDFSNPDRSSTVSSFNLHGIQDDQNVKGEQLSLCSIKSQPNSTSEEPKPQKKEKLKRRSKNTRAFLPVEKVIVSWLRSEPLTFSLDSLSDFQLLLIATIIRRKCSMKSFPKSEEDPKKVVERLFLRSCMASNKRTKKKKKFIFKHILKIIKQKFKESQSDSLTEEELDQKFRDRFFNGGIYNFKKEKSTKNPNFNVVDSLTLSNLTTVFKNSNLLREFESILFQPSEERSEFIIYYLSIIPKKVQTLFKKWERRHFVNVEKANCDILKYFSSSRQCKLPWTIEEINDAVRTLQKIIGLRKQNQNSI